MRCCRWRRGRRRFRGRDDASTARLHRGQSLQPNRQIAARRATSAVKRIAAGQVLFAHSTGIADHCLIKPVTGWRSAGSVALSRIIAAVEELRRSFTHFCRKDTIHRHAETVPGSTTRMGLICTFPGPSGIVSVIWYSAHVPRLFAITSYWRVRMPTPRFSLTRLKWRDHPLISLIRHRSHRTFGIKMPPSPDLDLYASAISSRVGSFCGVWPEDGATLIMASKAVIIKRWRFMFASDAGVMNRGSNSKPGGCPEGGLRIHSIGTSLV